MIDINEIIVKNISDRLKELNATWKDLGVMTGFSKKDVQSVRLGSKGINAIELKQIAMSLDTSVDELVKIHKNNKEDISVFVCGNISTSGGRKAIEIADKLSDMILFHAKVRKNGTKMIGEIER